MLLYFQQFCKRFPASSPPVWPTSCAAWRTLSPASLAHIRRALQATCRTPRRLHTPPLHVTRTDPPPPRSAARTWWTPRSVNLLNAQARTRPHQPHMHAMAVVCLGAPACSGVRVTKQRGSVPGLWCVPTGEIPVYLREKSPCTYGRSPCVPTGEVPCTYGRRNMR